MLAFFLTYFSASAKVPEQAREWSRKTALEFDLWAGSKMCDIYKRNNFYDLQDIVYYPSTNGNVLVCAFLPRSPERNETPDWYLVSLAAVPGSDMNEVQAWFDEAFLDEISIPSKRSRAVPASPAMPPDDASETDLLRRDVRNNVVNYDDWHCASAEDVLVVDNLDDTVRATFIPSLTNNLPRLRRAYASCVSTTLSATNQTAVVRVFRSREEYLAYVGVEQKWTAALWSPIRRELVLYHPESGTEQLLHTVWHEAFHQYLALLFLDNCIGQGKSDSHAVCG